MLICLFADRFEVFALAYFVFGLSAVVNVAWTCFMVEDIDTQGRIAAYNFINGLSLSAGIFAPISGFVVGQMGLVTGQKTILSVTFFVLIARILLRNHFGRETAIGKQILEENKTIKPRFTLLSGANLTALRDILHNRRLLLAVCASALWQVYVSTTAMNTSSIYYVAFLTNSLGIDQQLVSVIGTISSCFMLLSFLFITPRAVSKPPRRGILRNVLLLILSVLGLIGLGDRTIAFVAGFVAVYAIGYQGIQPLINTMTTDASAGCNMPSILSVLAILTASVTAVSGYVSGFLYQQNPYGLYLVSVLLLALLGVCVWLATDSKKCAPSEKQTNE